MASVYLKQLVDIGLLKEVKAGREKLFINPSLLQALRGTEQENRMLKGRRSAIHTNLIDVERRSQCSSHAYDRVAG